MIVVGYFDDNRALIDSVIDGRRIYDPAEMGTVVDSLGADEIRRHALRIAIPANEIIAAARTANAHVAMFQD